MPFITPIRAIRYTPNAGELSDLTCPPYDVISPAQQLALYQRSPYNCIRLELTLQETGGPAAGNRYEQAAATFTDWLERGIIAQDDTPGLYLYRQSFQAAGKQYSRRGVIAGLQLEPLGGRVKPHERTLAKAKADRLSLLPDIRTNISPALTLLIDPGYTLLSDLFPKRERPRSGSSMTKGLAMSYPGLPIRSSSATFRRRSPSVPHTLPMGTTVMRSPLNTLRNAGPPMQANRVRGTTSWRCWSIWMPPDSLFCPRTAS